VLSNYQSLVDVLIQDELDGKPHHEKILLLGDTPEYLVEKAQFPPLQLAIKSSILSKACFDHGIATPMLKRLPDIIGSPKCLFRSASQVGSVVVVTLEIKGGNPIVIPLRPNMQVGRGAFYNLVVSMYAKQGPDPIIKWKDDGLLIHEWPAT
jgi:hypothetical protein